VLGEVEGFAEVLDLESGERWDHHLAVRTEGQTTAELRALVAAARRVAVLQGKPWPALTLFETAIAEGQRDQFGRRRVSGGWDRFTRNTARLHVSRAAGPGLEALAGLEDVKRELRSYRDLINDRQRYLDAGCRVPRGLLLKGPPGVGKTAIARAFAQELGRPFYHQAASEFVELYIGVGAARVRDLFRMARASQPCVVFIDEIDAIGSRRGNASSGSDAERHNALNQLLVELDGFDPTDSVFVIGATNRDALDEALTRAGRFDASLEVPIPDAAQRREILRKQLGETASLASAQLERLAADTEGLVGAELENLVNRARIAATRAAAGLPGPLTYEQLEAARRDIERIMLRGHLPEEADPALWSLGHYKNV